MGTTVIFKYVQLQTDETKKWCYCSLKVCINIKVDRLTKKALKTAHSTGQISLKVLFHTNKCGLKWKGKW